MASVVLINSFEVPVGREEELLALWREAAAILAGAEGYVSTRLHESLDPTVKFRFVNVAEWASPQQFAAALGSDAFQAVARKMAFAAAYPALYRVVADDRRQ